MNELLERDTVYWAVACVSTLAGRGEILVPAGAKLRIRVYRMVCKILLSEADYTPRINPFQVSCNEVRLLLSQGYWRLLTPMELLAMSAEKTDE